MTRRRVLTSDEEEKLLHSAAPYIQDIICFALNTGLRIGEIYSLLWSHVDLEEGILIVFAPKTEKIREIPINRETLKILQAWRLARKCEFVFYNPQSGKPFVDLKDGFALACRKAEILGVTWHTLRHTFATRLLDRNVDIVTVQQLLGHSNVLVTMRYTHPNIGNKRAAVEKLGRSSDNLVTVGTKMQQSRARLSLKAV